MSIFIFASINWKLFLIQNDPAQQQQIDSCLRLLISTITLYFDAIKKLEESDQKTSLIKTSILTLSLRCTESSEDEELQTQEKALDNASKYVGGFCNFVDLGDPLTANEHVKLLKTIHDLVPRKDAFKLAIG